MSEHEFEPVRGLPEQLPPGEQLLWQGAPRWQSLAIHAFHARKVGLYFLVLIAADAVASLAAGQPVGAVAAGASWLVVMALAAVAVLAVLAWLTARTTVYTITSRRIVMRFGIALPMTINLPYTVIDSAAMRAHADGSTDLPVALSSGSKVGYLITWPHVRPWHFSRPQPMLRTIADGAHVADLLSGSLAAATGGARAPRAESAAPASAAVPPSAPRPELTAAA